MESPWVPEKPLGYGADAFDADVTKQPELNKVGRCRLTLSNPS